MNRRQALIHLGVGAAGWMVLPRIHATTLDIRPDRLADLAERIRSTPRSRCFDMAAEAIGAGATAEILLGATFLAGVHDVRPRPVGGNLHSVMMVEASYRLVEEAPASKEAWLVALWAMAWMLPQRN